MTRRKLDSYLSPKWFIDELTRHVPISGRVFEPCVGDGDLALPLITRGVEVLTNDIDPARSADYHLDAEQDDAWLRVMGRGVDWTITNPPYGKLKPDGKPDKKADPSYEMLIRALATSRVGVAFMLRLSFLEPVSTKPRGMWLHKHPPDLMIVMPRFSFTGNGNTDSVTTGWFVWINDPTAELPRGIRVAQPNPPQRRQLTRN